MSDPAAYRHGQFPGFVTEMDFASTASPEDFAARHGAASGGEAGDQTAAGCHSTRTASAS